MGKDHLGSDQRKVKEADPEEKEIKALDEGDIALLKTYGQVAVSSVIIYRAVVRDLYEAKNEKPSPV